MRPETLQQREQHPLDQLAFYVNGTLTGSARGEIEAHLSACPSCRREVKEWEDLALAVEEDPVAIPDSSLAWERMERRIGKERGWTAREARESGFVAGGSWRRSPSLAWGLAAAQFALVVGLVVYLAAVRPAGPAWTTLAGPVSSEAKGARLQVIFQEEATAEEIADLLGSAAGQIVQGPSGQGVYVVAIPDRAAVAVESAVALFQSRSDIVRWVQYETQ